MANQRGAEPPAAVLGSGVTRKSDGRRLAKAAALALLFDALALGALGALIAGAMKNGASDGSASWLSVQLEPPVGTELATRKQEEYSVAAESAGASPPKSSSVPSAVSAAMPAAMPAIIAVVPGSSAGTELAAGPDAAAAEPGAGTGPVSGSAPVQGPAVNSRARTELASSTTREEVLVRLDEAIKRKLNYPPRARERGIEGRVLLEILVDEGGSLRTCAVEASSGSPMLDSAARRLLSDIFPLRASLAAPFNAFVAVEYRLR